MRWTMPTGGALCTGISRARTSSSIAADKAIVLDFGLAKRLLNSGEPHTVESMSDSQQPPAGTLSYMAPEVLLGGRADARSDVWSIGVLLYEIVTGDLPFKGRTAFETSAAILGEPQMSMGSPRAACLAAGHRSLPCQGPERAIPARIGCAGGARTDRGEPQLANCLAPPGQAPSKGAADRGRHHPARNCSLSRY